MKMRILGFHSSDHHLDGPFARPDLYLTLPGDPRYPGPLLYAVHYTASNVLIVRSGEQIRDLWQACGFGPDGSHFHPTSTSLFTRMLRILGYDAVRIEREAVGWHDPEAEVAHEWGAGTFGEPQAILFEPERANMRLVRG